MLYVRLHEVLASLLTGLQFFYTESRVWRQSIRTRANVEKYKKDGFGEGKSNQLLMVFSLSINWVDDIKRVYIGLV